MQPKFDSIAQALAAHSPFDVDGNSYALNLVEIRDPAEPTKPLHVRVTFTGEGNGQTHRGDLFLGRDRLDDPDYVVAHAITTIQKIVRNELPPGTVDYL